MLLVSLTSWSQSLTMANYYMCSSGQYRDNKEFSRFIFSEKWLQGDECFGNVRNTWKGCNDNYQLCCQSRAGWSQWCLLHKLQTSSAISVGKASNPSVGARGLCPPIFACIVKKVDQPSLEQACTLMQCPRPPISEFSGSAPGSAPAVQLPQCLFFKGLFVVVNYYDWQLPKTQFFVGF